MAEAYAVADAEANPQAYKDIPHYSRELDLLSKIDRFGLKAILGRDTFYHGELRHMIFAENIHTAYHARRNASSWAEWAERNPVMSKILFEIEKDNK